MPFPSLPFSFRTLALLLIAADIVSLLWLFQFIGFFRAMIIIFLVGLMGLMLVARSSAAFFRMMRQPGLAFQDITREGLNSLFGGLAGTLLMIPGLASDCLAALLLIPACRRQITGLVLKQSGSTQPPRTPSSPIIIDGEAVEVIDPARKLP